MIELRRLVEIFEDDNISERDFIDLVLTGTLSASIPLAKIKIIESWILEIGCTLKNKWLIAAGSKDELKVKI